MQTDKKGRRKDDDDEIVILAPGSKDHMALSLKVERGNGYVRDR